MSSGSSGVASGLGSQPSCSTPQLEQRSSFPARHLLPPQSRSLALLSQEDFLRSFNGYMAAGMSGGAEPCSCLVFVPKGMCPLSGMDLGSRSGTGAPNIGRHAGCRLALLPCS